MTLPWLTLILSLLLTTAAYKLVRDNSEMLAREKFASRKAEIIEAIDVRMTAYTQALQGGLGLFRASETVDRDAWRRYVETLNLDGLYPGIQGIGFAEWVLPSELADYEARIQAEGFDGFTIRPRGPREIYSSIIYLEPFDKRNRQAFGYDMFSQETRRSAMELARDTGEVAISGRVTLVQEISSDVQAGFLMYLPYYNHDSIPANAEERRATSVGFVYSPFRMRNLLEGILGPGLPDVRLEIYDGAEIDPDALMYDSQSQLSGRSPAFERIEQMIIGQRPWTLRTSSLPKFETLLDPQKSYIVLTAGLFTSLLFFGIVWSFARTRERAQELAEEMTITLKQHTRDLARSNEDLKHFAYVASHDLKAPLRGIDNLAAWIEEDLGDKLSGEPRDHMRLLRGRIGRLEALLNDLLSYSRAGQVESKIEKVDLKELITATWDVLNTEQKFTFGLDLQLAENAAETRATALEQVLINLFSNALKHHDRQDGQIFISVTEQADCFEFTVADDGPGIPAEQRERAFQMFHTLRPRDEVEGSGMGLAIIRRLIERIGGKIVAEGRSGGRGAQFRFTWPKASISATENPDPGAGNG